MSSQQLAQGQLTSRCIPMVDRFDTLHGAGKPPCRSKSARVGEAQLRSWMVGGLDGNAGDYHQLLGAVSKVLSNFYASRVRMASDRDDLIQNVLLAVHERRATYDRSRPFTPWLFAIARYKLADYLRQYRPQVALDDNGADILDPGFEASCNASMDVENLLAFLPGKQARAIRSTRLRGLSVAEAATFLGISESDLKVSVHRGLAKLAAIIRPTATSAVTREQSRTRPRTLHA